MKRTWRYVSLLMVLALIPLAACAQSSAPAAPSAEKPVEKAAAKPAEKAAEKPAEKVAEKPVEKAEAKPVASKDLPATIAVGTHAVGTSYNSVGTGLAKVLSDRSPIKVMVKPFAGPNAWMPLLESAEIHLGVLNGMDAGWAYSGGTGFDKPNKGLRTIARGNVIENAFLFVRADSDIKSLKDLKGKRVTSEYGGNTVIREIVTAAIESVGLTWNDVKPVPVPDINNGQKAVREGRADAAFGGATTTAVTLETDAAIGIRALDFGDLPPDKGDSPPKEMVDKLRTRVPGADIFRQTPKGFMKEDHTLIRYPIMLAASEKLSADAAYEITKAVYENDKELQAQGGWLANWKQQSMFDENPPAPYHEGAIRFWKEKGIWTPAAEANQKRLLR